MLEMTMDHAKKEVTISQAGSFHNDDKVSLQVVKQLLQELLNDYKLKLEWMTRGFSCTVSAA